MNSGQVFPAVQNNKVLLPFEFDWTNQDTSIKAPLQAHLNPASGMVFVEGAIAKPTIVRNEEQISLFPPELRPQLIHSTGRFEITQNNRRKFCRYQLYPDGRLLVTGTVDKGQKVDQMYIILTYNLNNGVTV